MSCRDSNKVKHEFQEVVGGGWICRHSDTWGDIAEDHPRAKESEAMKMLRTDRVHYTTRLEGSGYPMLSVFQAFVNLLRFMTIVVRRSVRT